MALSVAREIYYVKYYSFVIRIYLSSISFMKVLCRFRKVTIILQIYMQLFFTEIYH